MFISLSEPAFRGFLLGMIFTYIPMTMQMVTSGYLAYTLSGRATDLGLVALAWGIPSLVFTLFAGVIADRYERRRILLVTQGLVGFLTLGTAFLIHTGLIEVWQLIAIGFLQGLLFAFNLPARQGLLPEVVSEAHVANGVAVNNSFFNLTRIFGPSLAGVLIAVPWFGIAGVYDLMAACYFTSSVMLFRLKLGAKPAPSAGRKMLADIADGLRYVAVKPTLWVTMLLGFVFVTFGMPYQNLMPVVAVSVLDVGSAGLGMLMTMAGLGALIGSLALGALADYPRKGLLQIVSALIFGVLLAIFAYTTSFPAAAALMLVIGGLGNFYMSLNNTLLVLNTDRVYLGRVMSIYMLTWSIMPLMVLPVSAAADAFGVQITLATIGLVVTALTAAIAVFARRTALAMDPAPSIGARSP
jgi:MFS family permease